MQVVVEYRFFPKACDAAAGDDKVSSGGAAPRDAGDAIVVRAERSSSFPEETSTGTLDETGHVRC